MAASGGASQCGEKVTLTNPGNPVHNPCHDDGHTEHHFDHHYLQLATPLAVAVPSWQISM